MELFQLQASRHSKKGDMEYYVLASLVMILNILDSVTTYIGLNKLPVGVRATESNPIMRGLLIKHPLIAEIIKQGLCLGLILWVIYHHDLFSLKVIMLMLAQVVASNTYLVIARKVTGKKIKSPLHKFSSFLRIPEKIHFAIYAIVIFGVALNVAWFLWR